MKRRDFFKTSIVASATILGSTSLAAGETHQPNGIRKISKYTFPEKRALITHSNRPPLLETPLSVFTEEFTPNDQFFVRWHLPDIPTRIDLDSFTINVNGFVEKELKLSLDDLKNNFEQVEVNAVVQCGGNSRSAFTPIPGGVQWGSGAMGCAKWKGVRLKDILEKAGLKKGAEWVGFNGLEKPAYYKTPDFVRELELSELNDHVIVAYEMNGEDLPYLNGYPVRLVIPGYYSDSWIKMLGNITVTNKYKALFFMDKGYRVPDNKTESETPEHKAKKTIPITSMNVKSIIGYPENNTNIYHNSEVVVRGVAWDGGYGIEKVLISIDNGKTWEAADLKEDLGRYAYRSYRFSFKPTKYGKLKIMAKAINSLGDEQPLSKDIGWNGGGYKYNGIHVVNVKVV